MRWAIGSGVKLAAVAFLLVACGAPSASGSNAAREQAQRERDEANAASVKEHLDDFGHPGFETSWYSAIHKVEVRGSQVKVRTNLKNDAQGKEKAKAICSATSGFVYANPNQGLGLSQVQVLDDRERPLADRRNLQGPC
jgi:hypothetical protein